ncbi:reverse transcriptase (RNA-dependent DNA polymerase) [Hirsutella rhossiliensis]
MKYMLTITDQATGRVWVYFSRDKTRITDKIKAWVVVAEAECREYGKGEKVKAMRFDRGKEFLNEAMKESAENKIPDSTRGRGTQRAEKQRAELEWRQREEQRMAERLKKRGESGRKERAMVARTLLQPNTDLYDFDPKKLTFRQAMKGSEKDQWVGAIDEEVQNLIRRQTFSEEINEGDVHGEEVVDAKLVFDHKKDKEGKILRYKARLVARGFTQKHGINYEETFAPTIRLDAMRIILALAAKKGWKVYQMDAVAAFLAADLKERIFMKVPTELQQYFGKYVQILKSLISQGDWFLTDDSGPDNIQTYRVGVIIGVHVDDFMITGGDEDAIERVKEKLKGRFEMKDLGEAENILGIRIQRHKGKLMIDQSQFAKEIVAEFLYDDSMKHATPMEPGAIRKLVEEPGRPLNHDEWLKYVELLGS